MKSYKKYAYPHKLKTKIQKKLAKRGVQNLKRFRVGQIEISDTIKQIWKSLADSFFKISVEDCKTKISLRVFSEIKIESGKEI